MTEEIKIKLFEDMLNLEKMAELQSEGKLSKFVHTNYNQKANGFYEALEIMGIGAEYVRWSEGK